MGKRSDKPKIARDFYPTPRHAVDALLPHLCLGIKFDEPCAGDGALIDHLESVGASCEFASDIEPKGANIIELDAMLREECRGNCFITNPPYTWQILNPLIIHLSRIAPTWLLLPADMMHNKRMAPHMDKCSRVVSVGRVKWFGGGGMENSAWYLFQDFKTPTTFYSR